MNPLTESSTNRSEALQEAIEQFEYFTRGGAAYDVEKLFANLSEQATRLSEQSNVFDVQVDRETQPTLKLHIKEEDFVIGGIQAELDKEQNTLSLAVFTCEKEVFATIAKDVFGLVLFTPVTQPNAFGLDPRRVGPRFMEELTLVLFNEIHKFRVPE